MIPITSGQTLQEDLYTGEGFSVQLEGKVVAVTAAARGIGWAIVQACARQGATVYLGVRAPETVRTRTAALEAEGHRVRCVYFDAKKDESNAALLDTAAAQEGRLDVLVNNFGSSDPSRDRDLAGTDPADFLDTVTLNLKSVFLASQAAVRHMRKTGGSIINISSIGGLVPDRTQIAYGTSKAAINYLTKLIAVQEAHHQIRCNAVLPGMTATDAVQKNLSGAYRDVFLRHTPLGRMARPEEIAAAVVYLASDSAAFTTGQLLTVSGGFGLATPLYGDRTCQT